MSQYYDVVIELRGRVFAKSESDAMAIARETASNLADGEVGRLSDHLIDEVEATRVSVSEDQED